MCLIAWKPKGKIISREILEEGFKSNDDGAGIAYVDNNELYVDKGFFKFEDFIKCYDELIAEGDRDVLIHFRNASFQMVIDEPNCHPFYFDSGEDVQTERDGKKVPRYQFAVVHNGKLDWRHTDKRSDTACFIDDLLQPMLSRDPWMLEFEYGPALLKKLIGDANKVVILRHDVEEQKTDTYIINKDGSAQQRVGHEKDGCWFSNHSYVKVSHPYYGGNARANGEPTDTEYEKVDKDGWHWSYMDRCWSNIITHERLDYYPGDKRLRPYAISVHCPSLADRGMATRRTYNPDDLGLGHLNELDRGVFLRVAGQYGRAVLIGRPTIMASIAALRTDIRRFFVVDAGTLTNNELDKWIVTKDRRSPGCESKWLLDARATTIAAEAEAVGAQGAGV